MRRLNVNLATRPLRNRRLFLLLAGLLGAAFLVTSLIAIIIFFQFSLKRGLVKAGLEEANASIRTAQTEQKRLAARVKEAVDKDQDIIDTINGVILKKSFSWTGFLSKLEECLPNSSYILSLAVPQIDNTLMQFRVKVVSQSLDDLLDLINRLQDLNFTRPRVETEERNDRGQLVSEISVTYERAI
jgi:Tfp pilus assembly protein PilN